MSTLDKLSIRVGHRRPIFAIGPGVHRFFASSGPTYHAKNKIWVKKVVFTYSSKGLKFTYFYYGITMDLLWKTAYIQEDGNYWFMKVGWGCQFWLKLLLIYVGRCIRWEEEIFWNNFCPSGPSKCGRRSPNMEKNGRFSIFHNFFAWYGMFGV